MSLTQLQQLFILGGLISLIQLLVLCIRKVFKGNLKLHRRWMLGEKAFTKRGHASVMHHASLEIACKLVIKASN